MEPFLIEHGAFPMFAPTLQRKIPETTRVFLEPIKNSVGQAVARRQRDGWRRIAILALGLLAEPYLSWTHCIISRYVLDRFKLAWRAASFHPPLRTDVRRIRGSLAILASIF
jgi:hypothetical protein